MKLKYKLNNDILINLLIFRRFINFFESIGFYVLKKNAV
jgi:hypothetical protein